MSKFTKDQLIDILSPLGEQLLHPDEALETAIDEEQYRNAWFTPESVKQAVSAAGKMLQKDKLTTWLDSYAIDNQTETKKVGLILAGNIPLVGFHDVLCVLVSGNHALIKASSQDARLIIHILNKLVALEPAFTERFTFIDRLVNFDAVIATGSNNTSRYFDYYFGKVPNIIRKNRNSVAVLTGDETAEQLYLLGRDIFDYYGLGCRNVSKLMVPEGYVFNFFFESIETYQPIINHHKYNNNYDYNKSIYLVNGAKHLDNGFLLVKDDENWISPLAALFYEEYKTLAAAEAKLNSLADNIQCVVSVAPLNVNTQLVGFGKSQEPELWDYADGVDTMAFLMGL